MFPNLPSTWTIKKIGELCDVSRGASPRPIHDQRYFEGGTIPWIKIADATKSGKYLYETKQYVNEFGASFSKLLPPGTILVAASGTLGYTQILGVEGCAHDGWLILQNLRDFDRDFAYYTLQWMERHFYNSAYGAAIQNINTTILKDTEIPYPPFPIQRKIAAVLSAYDDLIEVNTHRIRVLDEIVQAIYRKWFGSVDVESLPEGWGVKRIGDFGSVITGKTPSKKKDEYWNSRDVPFIRTPDMHDQFYCIEVTDYLSTEGANSQKNAFIPPNSLCVSCIGTVGIVTITEVKAQTNQQINSIILNDVSDLEFLYFELLGLKETIQSYAATGATMANLSKGKFMALTVICPPKELREKFHLVTSPMFEQIKSLQYRNANLRRTRDLLLPRLVSGEISVDKIELELET
jgi:type I restriction enzyme S subunit